jgi:hypothetical protein
MSWLITPGQPVPIDPFRSNVSLLLHGDGTNGSTTITDSSPSPKAVTAVGNAQISTAQSKFGGSSIAFDGNGDQLTVPTDEAFTLGSSGTYTVELWFYAAGAQTSFAVLASTFDNFNTLFANRWGLVINNTGGLTWYDSGGSGAGSLYSLSAISTNQWNHVAITGSGSTVTMWLNGISQGTMSGAKNYTTSSSLKVGYVLNAAYFNGYIDDLRITKGVARYTANFTPPTAPFPDI